MRRQAETRIEQQNLNRLESQHRKIHENSRQTYHIRRERAIQEPDEVMSVIVDCTKRVVPRVAHSFTNWASYDSEMQFQVVGCLAHGLGHLMHLWPDKMYSRNSAVVINILQEIIYLAQTRYHRHPSTLYIQMDNCTGENKNRYILGYSAYLVVKRIFQKVVINYLPVGHTHEDIDSVFSQLSHQLNQHQQCLTPKEFQDLVIKATKPEDGLFHVVKYLKNGIPNMQEPIADVLNTFSGIKQVNK